MTHFLILAVALQSGDTATYRDAATRALVTRAAERHSEVVSRLDGYAARVRSRLEGSVAPTRFARGLRVIGIDIVATVQWEQPSDVRVQVVGARSRVARLPGARREAMGAWMLGLVTSEPWFAPGAMGDEIDFMGIPDEPAMHPLAPGAERVYRYALVDSLVAVLPTRVIRTLAVQVEPRRYDRSLVQGTMWLDADSLDVVRLSVAFVGPGLWEEDDDESPRLIAAEADLEYGLHEGRYWLPLKQILTLDWRYRYLPGLAMPTRSVTTFDDYRLHELPPIRFERNDRPDGWDRNCDPWSGEPGRPECGERRAVRGSYDSNGLRFQIILPPMDSLERFEFTDSTVTASFDEESVGRRLTELAVRAGGLPVEARAYRRPVIHPVLAAALRDGFRFNRVQGVSLGGTANLRLAPLVALEPTARLSAGDERITGALALRRDGPDLSWWVQGHHALREAEPWTVGLSLPGSIRAVLMGDDAADYYLGTGGEIGAAWKLGPLAGTRVAMGWERQKSVGATGGSVVHDVFFGDGDLPINPAIADGYFGRVSLSHRRETEAGHAVEAGIDALAGGDRAAGRAWLVTDLRFAMGTRRGRLTARGGHLLGDSLSQLDFRAGGRHSVRGYEYGVRRGRGLWAVQGELEIWPNEWAAPLLLVDVGNVIGGGAGDPLVGVGVGLSAGNGWLRIDLMKGVNPGTPVRADIGIQVPVW
jgi:hypothetical protein